MNGRRKGLPVSDLDEPEKPASGLPLLVLGAGLVAVVFASATLLVNARHPIEGVLVFIIPVLVLGLGLIGLWLKWKLRGELEPPVKVGQVPTTVPGNWYIPAVLVIAAALFLWLKFYQKL